MLAARSWPIWSALTDILSCFRPGGSNLLTGLIQRRIGRILVAATKADHLHHESHDRLQAIVRRLVERAMSGPIFQGRISMLAMPAAVRTTREATVTEGNEALLPLKLSAHLLKGERIDGEVFD
nr:YcjX family protein [Brucella abortus]